MLGVKDFLIIPNPAHKPRFYSGFPGLHSSFPSSYVCVVYIYLTHFVDVDTLSLRIEATAQDGTALKTSLYSKEYDLWTVGMLMSDQAQDRDGCIIRYLDPEATFESPSPLDPRAAAALDKRPLFPTPRPSRLQRRRGFNRGLHLFYCEFALDSNMPTTTGGDLSCMHTMQATMRRAPSPIWDMPGDYQHSTWVEMDVPKYNSLPAYVHDQAPMRPINIRNDPSDGDALAYEISLSNAVLMPECATPVMLRFHCPSLRENGNLLSGAAGPSVTLTLLQTTTHKRYFQAGKERVTTKTEIVTKARDRESFVGQYYRKRIMLHLPQLADTGVLGSQFATLHPSSDYKIAFPPRRQAPVHNKLVRHLSVLSSRSDKRKSAPPTSRLHRRSSSDYSRHARSARDSAYETADENYPPGKAQGHHPPRTMASLVCDSDVSSDASSGSPDSSVVHDSAAAPAHSELEQSAEVSTAGARKKANRMSQWLRGLGGRDRLVDGPESPADVSSDDDGVPPPEYTSMHLPLPATQYTSPGYEYLVDDPLVLKVEQSVTHTLLITLRMPKGTAASPADHGVRKSGSIKQLLGRIRPTRTKASASSDQLQIEIPVIVNHGQEDTLQEILRHVCA
ncbi:phosphatidylserine decarboxylase 1 [Sorochytrium milnesiophthora]